MTCTVPKCGTWKFTSYSGMRMHWRKWHLASVLLHACPLCTKSHPKRCEITKHLLSVHFVPMTTLRRMLQHITTWRNENKKCKPPGSLIYPGRPIVAAAHSSPSSPPRPLLALPLCLIPSLCHHHLRLSSLCLRLYLCRRLMYIRHHLQVLVNRP